MNHVRLLHWVKNEGMKMDIIRDFKDIFLKIEIMIILVLLKYQFVRLEVDYCHLKLQSEASLTGLLGTSCLALSSVEKIHL